MKAHLLSLFIVSLFTGSAFASIDCEIHEGSGCGGPMVYKVQLCADITIENAYCKSLCEQQKPICAVGDFDPWVSADHLKGKRGLKGPLADNADDYDETGLLKFTSEKSYTVCMKNKFFFGARLSDFRPKNQRTCPRAKIASADTCAAGTVFHPETGTCEIQDPSCGGGNSTYTGIMNQGQMLVNVQNEHYIDRGQVDPNLVIGAATAATFPGLVDPTKINDGSASGGNLSGQTTPLAKSFRPSNSSSQGGQSGSNLSALPVTAAADAIVAAIKPSDSKSGSFGGSASGDSYRGGSDTGTGGGGNSGLGSSSFGGEAAATAGGASGEAKFAGGTRGLTADGRLIVEDPDNYFMRSDIDLSLFKRVTVQCRKKERSLVLAP